jgi:hypothetical protein
MSRLKLFVNLLSFGVVTVGGLSLVPRAADAEGEPPVCNFVCQSTCPFSPSLLCQGLGGPACTNVDDCIAQGAINCTNQAEVDCEWN